MPAPIASACVVLFVAACLAGPQGSLPPPSGGVPTAPDSGLSLADATLTFGAGPTPDASVTYQPDVVLVGGGPSVIRWASADSLTWAIDASAPHARDLVPGSVMFLTSVAMGRVADIQDDGDSRIVTLAPIQLTDLVRDADLQVDQDVSFDSVVYHQLAADFPATDNLDAEQTPGPDAAAPGHVTVELPTLRLAAAHPGDALGPDELGLGLGKDKLTTPSTACTKVTLGKWGVEYCAQPRGGLSIGIEAAATEQLKLGLNLKLFASKLHLHAGTTIKDGQVTQSGGLLDGLTGFGVGLSGGVSNGASDNVKLTAELPVEIESPSVVVGGIPFKLLIEGKFLIDTAFSGKNSTMSADGEYTLTGPMGIVDGKPVIPALTVKKSLVDSLRGITLGPSGVVFTAKTKFLAGVGVYGFAVGPQLTWTISLGLGRGSVIGAPLAECNGAQLGMWVGAGAGVNINGSKLSWIFGKGSFFQKYVKLETSIDIVQYEIFNRKVVSPDVPICTG